MPRAATLLLLTALCASGLGACAPRLDRRALLAPLIGVSETELVARMGVPNRVYQTGDVKFLAYGDRRIDVIPGTYPFWGPWSYPYGGFPPEA